jgi:lipoprotein-anchoring transpeptidase ErfK/SrfK
MSPTHCANCECENPPGAKFCNACGAQLQRLACPSCGAGIEVGATTCRQCQAALPGGETRTVAVSSIETDARSADAEFDAALQALRERLPMIGVEYAQAPAADRGGTGAPADELGPAIATANLPGPSRHYPTTDLANRSGRPGHRAGRMRLATVAFGTAALAAAGVAAFYAFDHRERADALEPAFAAWELTGKPRSAARDRPVIPDATDFPPAAASIPHVTHGVAKSAAPTAAAPADPGLSERAAPRPDPPAAVRESRVTSAAPAGDPLPRVTHGVAKSAAPAAATAAVPREAAAQPGATTAQRENRATAVVPAAGASAPPRADEGGTGIERPRPARIGPCTEAVATLGLCNPEPTQRRE